MDRQEEIKKYLEENKKYKKKAVLMQLKNAGYTESEINMAMGIDVNLPSSSMHVTSSSTGLIIAIVIIVLALVGIVLYSIVDFGSLDPNKIDLNNNLQGHPTESFANSANNEVVVVFTYRGPKRMEISQENGILNLIDGVNKCDSYRVDNVDTLTSTTTRDEGKWVYASPITFLNGQVGVMYFKCGNELEFNDYLEGNISINLINVKSSIEMPSSGKFKLSIS